MRGRANLSRMTRVLFVSGEYPPDVGGVGDYTLRLRQALGELGCPSELVGRRQVRRWDARALLWLARRAPRSGIVHVQFQPAAFDLLGDVCLTPALLRALRPRVRVVTTFHDVRVPYLFPKAGRLRWDAVRLLAHTSHAVVAADERDLAALGVGAGRAYHIPIGSNLACAPPPGYDRAAFRARLGIADVGLVYFGLLNASKGLDVLLEAFSLLLRRRPAARLLLLGGPAGASDPTDRQVAGRLAGRLAALGEHIVQPGFLPPAELSAYLLAGDVAVLPYADGASPRRGSLLACAAHRLPVVSTRPVNPTVAAAVLPVMPGDAEGLAEATLRILDDASLRAGLVAGSRALAARTSWRGIAERHLEVYRALGSGPALDH